MLYYFYTVQPQNNNSDNDNTNCDTSGAIIAVITVLVVLLLISILLNIVVLIWVFKQQKHRLQKHKPEQEFKSTLEWVANYWCKWQLWHVIIIPCTFIRTDKNKSKVPELTHELESKPMESDLKMEKNPAYSVIDAQDSSVDHTYDFIPAASHSESTL